MEVVKRDGTRQAVEFDKILKRIQSHCTDLDPKFVEPVEIAKKVIEGLYDGVSTLELDQHAAETAATMSIYHSDYAILAGRLAISNLHKQTSSDFYETAEKLYNYISPINNEHSPLISDELYDLSLRYRDEINQKLDYSQDLTYDYFAFKTLEKSYLIRINGTIVERPQHMLMRVALGIHGKDLAAAFETYDLLKDKRFTHATPTLFNAGTNNPQLSSCFLLGMQDDSLEGIFNTITRTANISKWAGGVGLWLHNIRAKGSYIRGTNGKSDGIIPMLKVLNEVARYVNQGGKRKGAFSVYLEPWHADIFDFIRMRQEHLAEEFRCLDLFPAIWMPDLFMEKVKNDEDWALFCPNEAPNLYEVWGDEFESLYNQYVSENRQRRMVKARELWDAILTSQIETGYPYILFKDAANRKSNQQHLGTIKSSNLCTEIMEFSGFNKFGEEEVAVCNLASIALNSFVKKQEDGTPYFDYVELMHVTRVTTRNLNKIIDINFYPLPEMARSNQKHRPIGIGIQGLADTFVLMRYPFESIEARKLNKKIAETMYFAALDASCRLAEEEGPYVSYYGSPASQGNLQFDLWGVTPKMWDWNELKGRISKYGLRNSLLMAPMPTATSAQILGNNECFEPFTSNLYTRVVLSGEYNITNKHLIKDLVDLGLWNETIRQKILAEEGSIQKIGEIPEEIRELYKTVWEMKQSNLIQLAADRGPFICQSQSMNIFFDKPTVKKLQKSHFKAWESGLKTGMYYLRQKPAKSAIKFTVKEEIQEQPQACSIDNPDCISCSS